MRVCMPGDTPEEANLEEIVADRVSDLRWTKTAYFVMGKWVWRASRLLDVILIASTGALATVLYEGWLSTRYQFIIAAVATTFSLASIAWNLDTKAYKYKKNGEEYNSLLKEFEEYYQLTLLNDAIPFEKKEEKLRELTKQHRTLNNMTDPTADWAYKRISAEDLGGTKTFNEFRQA